MSIDTTNNAQEDDLRSTLTEIDHADQSLQNSLEDRAAGETGLSPAAIAHVNEDRMELLRRRAQNQRERGKKNLEQRHAGVASVMARIELNERTVASAFERWFAASEIGIYVLQKRGALVLGDARADKLTQAMNERIVNLEAETLQALAIVNTMLEKAKNAAEIAGAELLVPTYAEKAAAHEVQLRSPTAVRVMKVFKMQDEIMVKMVMLSWNEAVTEGQIANQAEQNKKGVRDLVNFLQKTVRGMKKNVSVDDAKEATAANDAPAVAGVAGSLLEAAA